MKCFSVLQGIGLVGALALSGAAQAGTLNIKLTVSQQGLDEAEIAPGLTKSTILRAKITSKEILQRLAAHYSQPFPVGAVLFLDSEGVLYVHAKDGAPLLTVEESVFSVNVVSDSLISDTDKTTPTGGNYTGTSEFLSEISFDSDPAAIHFSISGPSNDRFTLNYGSGRYTYSWSAKASGDGNFDGHFVLVSGSADEKEIGVLE